MAETAKPASSTDYYPSTDCWVEEGGKIFLIGGRCTKCGKHTFPRRPLCDACCGTNIESVRVGDVGTLYSFSEIHVAPKAFTTPYTIGYVDFPNDVRVFGQVQHPAADLRPDVPVKVVLGTVRKSDNGQPVISYQFRKNEK